MGAGKGLVKEPVGSPVGPSLAISPWVPMATCTCSPLSILQGGKPSTPWSMQRDRREGLESVPENIEGCIAVTVHGHVVAGISGGCRFNEPFRIGEGTRELEGA